MLLQELFNQQPQSTWDIQGEYAEYNFTVQGISYTIYLQKVDLDLAAELSNYEFDLRMVGEIWFVEFGNDTTSDRYGITNTGNASEVLGNVIAALNMFKHSHPNAAFFFTAEEPSRRRLYDAIVSRVGRSRQVKPSKFPDGSRGFLVM